MRQAKLREDQQASVAPVANQPNWVKDLVDKRYQPQTERLKRSPVGFNFTREPFDPSSYYRSLEIGKNINVAATNVTKQMAQNHADKEAQAQFDANQKAILKNIGGIDPKFTYSSVGGTSSKFNTSGVSKKYKLKGVSPNTAAAADYFGSKYGIKTVWGKGPGSVPGSDHPKGRATDFMTYNNKAKGNALANDVIQNYKAWNVKYVIWNRYIWQPGRGWHKYSGPSPHTDHVHVSYLK